MARSSRSVYLLPLCLARGDLEASGASLEDLGSTFFLGAVGAVTSEALALVLLPASLVARAAAARLECAADWASCLRVKAYAHTLRSSHLGHSGSVSRHVSFASSS